MEVETGSSPSPISPPFHLTLRELYAQSILCVHVPNSFPTTPSTASPWPCSPKDASTSDVGYSRGTHTAEALRGWGVRNFWVPAVWILVSKERLVLLCGMALGPRDSSSPHKESSAGEGPGENPGQGPLLPGFKHSHAIPVMGKNLYRLKGIRELVLGNRSCF